MQSIPAWSERSALRVGEGAVVFEHVAGRTVVRRAISRAPLRILVPRGSTEVGWAFVSGLGGGLVDGDEVVMSVVLGERARAVVTTQGTTKAYRTPRAGAYQRSLAVVGDGALLALLPEPVTPFAGASFAQTTHVSVAQEGAAVILDALTAGRVARGERWASSRLESRLCVERAGELLVDEALLLDPAHGPIAERMGRFDVVLQLVLVGPALEAAAKQVLARATKAPLSKSAEALVAASPLPSGGPGALLRIIATSTERALVEVREALQFLPGLLGEDPFRGKW